MMEVPVYGNPATFFKFHKKIPLKGFTLIIPSISVGNVPQLTIDLLIVSLKMTKIATVWHPAIVSSIGADPYDANSTNICTACELYACETRQLALLQLRSSITIPLAANFFHELESALLHHEIHDVVVLASSFDYEMPVVSADKFYYISSNKDLQKVFAAANIKPIKPEFNEKYLVHGSGYAVKLFESFCRRRTFIVAVLVKYVSEGDNRPDAIQTVDVLRKLVKGLNDFDMGEIQFPCSWNCVFGGPPPSGLY